MCEDPNVDRMIEEAIKPLLIRIKKLELEIRYIKMSKIKAK